jgi:hypothetical protein
MKNLFIIGNGFDLDHGLNTKYEDFHEYLLLEYPGVDEGEIILPEENKHGRYDETEVVSFLIWIINNANTNGNKWGNLEYSMGLLDLGEFFDEIPELLDEDGDPDYWSNMYNVEDVASKLIVLTQKITEFFAEWIDTIEVTDSITQKIDFVKLINSDNDLFLTFNYTNTLEFLYKAKHVCHIHGEQGKDLLFGHGNDNNYYDEHMSNFPGSEDSLQQIQYALRKKTDEAVKLHQSFFESLSPSIEKIYSYGFSFSDVDKIYIQEICYRLNTENIYWYLNDFDRDDQLENYRNVIRSCGFQGQFSTYHIS